jgi:hypothetical protein
MTRFTRLAGDTANATYARLIGGSVHTGVAPFPIRGRSFWGWPEFAFALEERPRGEVDDPAVKWITSGPEVGQPCKSLRADLNIGSSIQKVNLTTEQLPLTY